MCKHIEIAVQILYCYLNSLNCIYMDYGLEDFCLDNRNWALDKWVTNRQKKFQTVVFGFDTNNTSPFNLGMQLY